MTKNSFRLAITLAILGFVTAWTWAYLSEQAQLARAFLESDSEIHAQFGNIKFSVLYVFKISTQKNHTSNMGYLVFAEKKTGSVQVAVRKMEDGWLVNERKKQ